MGEIHDIKPHEFYPKSYPSFFFVSQLIVSFVLISFIILFVCSHGQATKILELKNNDKNPPAKLPKWFGERPGKKPGDPESPDDVIFLKSHVHLFIIIFSSF